MHQYTGWKHQGRNVNMVAFSYSRAPLVARLDLEDLGGLCGGVSPGPCNSGVEQSFCLTETGR